MATSHIPLAALERKKMNGRFAPTIPECQCKHCGVTYRPKRKDRTSYCSRDCSYAAQKAAALPDQVLKQIALDKARAKAKGPFSVVCSVCAKPHVSKLPHTKYCSDLCRKAGWTRPKVHVACVDCGVTVTGTMAKHLCDRCNRKRSKASNPWKARKRAKRHGVAYQPINPAKVFERDNWTCQICGSKTPAKQRGTIDINAPELDHRIPISKGGPHTWENVQCACRRCNIAKGNKSSAGQMPLFATPPGTNKSTAYQ